MAIKSIGLMLVLIGGAIFIFGGGLPNHGLKKFTALLSQYRIRKENSQPTDQEQQGAYATYCAYLVGSTLVIVGSIIVFLMSCIGE